MKILINRTLFITILLIALVTLLGSNTQADNPIRFSKTGQPLSWRKFPIVLSMDQGRLGTVLSNDQARMLVNERANIWPALPTVSKLSFMEAQLPMDITGANYMQFVDSQAPDVNPVIFDDDGSVTNLVLGEGAAQRTRGFAGFNRFNPTTGEILRGNIVLNGTVINSDAEVATYRLTITHEVGHFLGVIHTQTNRGDFNTLQPLMFPVSVMNRAFGLDDQLAMSRLYPADNLASTTATIRGRVFFPDGQTQFEGANVVIRNTSDPAIVVATVSGTMFTNYTNAFAGSPDPNVKGFYEVRGLPPGTYTVEVEEIRDSFSGGSRVGVLPPVKLAGVPEFYNEGESSTDNPTASTQITVAAGDVRENINIILNGTSSDFTLTATPSTQTIRSGDRATITINAAAVGSFTGSIGLSTVITSLRNQTTQAELSDRSISTPGVATVTVSTSAETPATTFLIIILGRNSDGTLVRSLATTVTVQLPAFNNPKGGDTGVKELHNSTSLAFSSFSIGKINSDTSVLKTISTQATAGQITTVAGNGLDGFVGDNGLANRARLSSPAAVVSDKNGDFYIADAKNNRIRRVDGKTRVITTFAGNGKDEFSGDGALAINAGLSSPTGLTIDKNNNIFFVDAGNSRVRRIDSTTNIITTVAGNGASGFDGDGRLAKESSLDFNFTFGDVAVDNLGNLFIADSFNERIRRVDSQTGTINTVVGKGTSGFSGDGGPAANASLFNPVGVALDNNGNIFIVDADNNRVRRVDIKTGIISTVAGNGQISFSGDNGLATSASLSNPEGIAIDGAGNIFIADTNNLRIRRVDAKTGVITTIAGNGEFSPEEEVDDGRANPKGKDPVFLNGDNGIATNSSLGFPEAIHFNAQGDLLIADTQHHAVRLLVGSGQMIAITSASFVKPNLTINGSGFGKSGAIVSVNGLNISSLISSQTDNQIMLKGNKKKFGLQKGANKVVVTVDGLVSNTFILNFFSKVSMF